MQRPEEAEPVPPNAIEQPQGPVQFFATAPTIPVKPTGFPATNLTAGQAATDVFLIFTALVLLFVSSLGWWLLETLNALFPSTEGIFEGLAIGGTLILTVAVLLLARRQWPGAIGLGRPRGLHLLWALAAIPACYVSLMSVGIVGVAIHLWMQTDLTEMMAERPAFFELLPERNLMGFLLIGAFTGFHEELLFRGFLLTRFTAIVRYPWLAMVICAAVFGLLHYPGQGWMGVFQTAGIGFVLGSVTLLARSLWPAIIAHAAFNSIQLAIFPLLERFLQENMPALEQAGATSAPAVMVRWLL